MSCFYENGLQFECQRCSNCCRIDPGIVIISKEEATRIANYLSISFSSFLKSYCRRVYAHERVLVSLQEKENYDCIFWDEEKEGCKIYSVRPTQCQTFPFWNSHLTSKKEWDSCKSDCPGINKGKLYSYDEIEVQRKRYEDIINDSF